MALQRADGAEAAALQFEECDSAMLVADKDGL